MAGETGQAAAVRWVVVVEAGEFDFVGAVLAVVHGGFGLGFGGEVVADVLGPAAGFVVVRAQGVEVFVDEGGGGEFALDHLGCCMGGVVTAVMLWAWYDLGIE